jgi:serine/threonine protein phosphatase PrpC
VALSASRYEYARSLASNRSISGDVAEVFERDDRLVVVIADGAGGIGGGAAASRAVLEAVKLAANNRAFPIDDVGRWADLLETTDADVYARGAGRTTAVIVVLGPHGILGASAGDSEAWVVTATRIDDLTVGQHTRRRLGTGAVVPFTFERTALAGVLLVATDGLLKYASPDVIAKVVREGAMGLAADQLVELVRLPSRSVTEDVAVVLVRGRLASARAS